MLEETAEDWKIADWVVSIECWFVEEILVVAIAAEAADTDSLDALDAELMTKKLGGSTTDVTICSDTITSDRDTLVMGVSAEGVIVSTMTKLA